MPSIQKNIYFLFNLILIFTLFLTGCNGISPQLVQAIPATPENTGIQSTSAPEITPSKSSEVLFFLPKYFPEKFIKGFEKPSNWAETDNPENADLTFGVGSGQVISQWVYAAAVPFPTVLDKIDSSALKTAWQEGKQPGFLPTSIYVDPGTAKVFTTLWGNPSAPFVEIVPENELLEKAWKQKTVLAIIPFEKILPRWKILEVDNQSPLRKSFSINDYALTVPFSFQTKDNRPLDEFFTVSNAGSTSLFPDSNRDPDKLTTVILTGVTALVRGTAYLMEKRGMTYPAEDIRDILREADITHVNNEIPFTYKCPPPFMREDNLVFCSKPEYIKLLEDIGTDVVELAGDHFQDWGPEAVLYSIDLYKKQGWKYYGGGINLKDGRKALQMEVNGNKIAFIGCNAKPPGYAGARENQPGAVHCDFDWLKQEIKRVRSEGYIPISTFQHLEYYSYGSHPILQADFQKVADDGALIVSGSQAHQPQAMEFYQGSFLHFGLGNLFFDQFKEGLPERQAFMDRHIIYDNQYINTELITIQFIDLAKARLMTDEERQNLLQIVFKASGW